MPDDGQRLYRNLLHNYNTLGCPLSKADRSPTKTPVSIQSRPSAIQSSKSPSLPKGWIPSWLLRNVKIDFDPDESAHDNIRADIHLQRSFPTEPHLICLNSGQEDWGWFQDHLSFDWGWKDHVVMVTTMTMRLQFRVTSASGSSLLDIFEPWSGSGCPLLPDPSAYQVILIAFE